MEVLRLGIELVPQLQPVPQLRQHWILNPLDHMRTSSGFGGGVGLLGPHPCHLEVLRLGVELELQLLAYTAATATPDLSPDCDLHQSSPHRDTGSLTHWARPGIEPASSWILVRFVSTEPRCELLMINLKWHHPHHIIFFLWIYYSNKICSGHCVKIYVREIVFLDSEDIKLR